MEFSNYSLGRDDHCYKKTREEKRKSERRRDVCEWREGEKRANHSVSSKKKNKSENTGHNDNININNNDK